MVIKHGPWNIHGTADNAAMVFEVGQTLSHLSAPVFQTECHAAILKRDRYSEVTTLWRYTNLFIIIIIIIIKRLLKVGKTQHKTSCLTC